MSPMPAQAAGTTGVVCATEGGGRGLLTGVADVVALGRKAVPIQVADLVCRRPGSEDLQHSRVQVAQSQLRRSPHVLMQHGLQTPKSTINGC